MLLYKGQFFCSLISKRHFHQLITVLVCTTYLHLFTDRFLYIFQCQNIFYFIMSHGTVSLLPIAITQKSFRLMAETSYCHKFLYNYYSAAFVRQNLCIGALCCSTFHNSIPFSRLWSCRGDIKVFVLKEGDPNLPTS